MHDVLRQVTSMRFVVQWRSSVLYQKLVKNISIIPQKRPVEQLVCRQVSYLYPRFVRNNQQQKKQHVTPKKLPKTVQFPVPSHLHVKNLPGKSKAKVAKKKTCGRCKVKTVPYFGTPLMILFLGKRKGESWNGLVVTNQDAHIGDCIGLVLVRKKPVKEHSFICPKHKL